MSAAAKIISQALDAGVDLVLTEAGTIKARGEQAAVRRFAPLIREHRGAIIAVLAAAASPEDARIARVVTKLQHYPMSNYAIETRDEVDPDSVVLTVAIRGKAAGELRIPKSRYDAFALLELIERHTMRRTLQ